MKLLKRIKRRWTAQKRLDTLHHFICTKDIMFFQSREQSRETINLAISYAKLGEKVTSTELIAACNGRGVRYTGALEVIMQQMGLYIYSKDQED